MATILIDSTIKQTNQEALLTAEELFDAGDLGRGELVVGRFIQMPPPGYIHGRVETRISQALANYEDQFETGYVAGGEVGIVIKRNPDTVRAADVLFISKERFEQSGWQKGYLEVAPEIVVEVMSPSDRWSEVRRKLDEYFSINVLQVWVAEPETKSVYVYYDKGRKIIRLTENDILTSEAILPEFSLPVEKIFKGLS